MECKPYRYIKISEVSTYIVEISSTFTKVQIFGAVVLAGRLILFSVFVSVQWALVQVAILPSRVKKACCIVSAQWMNKMHSFRAKYNPLQPSYLCDNLRSVYKLWLFQYTYSICTYIYDWFILHKMPWHKISTGGNASVITREIEVKTILQNHRVKHTMNFILNMQSGVCPAHEKQSCLESSWPCRKNK